MLFRSPLEDFAARLVRRRRPRRRRRLLHKTPPLPDASTLAISSGILDFSPAGPNLAEDGRPCFAATSLLHFVQPANMSWSIRRSNVCLCCDEPLTFVDRISCIFHLDRGMWHVYVFHLDRGMYACTIFIRTIDNSTCKL